MTHGFGLVGHHVTCKSKSKSKSKSRCARGTRKADHGAADV